MNARIRAVRHRWFTVVGNAGLAAVASLVIHATLGEVLIPDEILSSYRLALVCAFVLFAAGVAYVGRKTPLAVLGVRHFFCYPPTWVSVALGLVFLAAAGFLPGPTLQASMVVTPICTYLAGIVLVSLLGSALVCLARWMRRRKPKDAAKPSGQVESGIPETFEELKTWFSDDRAIEHPDQDRFGHAVVAERIARRLRAAGTHSGAATIALVGQYGSGKSSILNLVQHYLQDDKIRLCRLSSWGFTSAEAGFRSIITAVIDELKKEVDCLALTGVPSALVSAMTSAGGWWSALSSFLDEPSNPDKILERVSDVLTAIDVQIVVAIEDLDRNPPESFNHDYCAALLDRFQHANGLSFILTAKSSGGSAGDGPVTGTTGTIADLAKLCRFDETVPLLPREPVWKALYDFRETARGIDGLIIPDRSRRNWQTPQYIALTGLPSSGPQRALLAAMGTPRILKSLLREVWDTWERLRGEIDFDQLVYAHTIRVAMPEVWSFALLNAPELRKERPQGSRPPNETEDRLVLGLKTARQRTLFDVSVSEELLRELFPSTPEKEEHRPVPTTLQGVSSHSEGVSPQLEIDYWGRLLAREVPDGEIKDQEVLRGIEDWNGDGENNTLAREYAADPKYRERVLYFREQFQGDARTRFAAVALQSLRDNFVSYDNDTAVVGSLQKLFGYGISADVDNFVDWWVSQVCASVSVRLHLALSLLRVFDRNSDIQDEQKDKAWSEMREKLHAHVHGKPQNLVEILKGGPYTLIKGLVEATKRDSTPRTKQEDWAYLCEVLLKAVCVDQSVAYGQVLALISKRVEKQPKGDDASGGPRWSPPYRLDDELVGQVFGKTEKLIPVLADIDPSVVESVPEPFKQFAIDVHKWAKSETGTPQTTQSQES